MMALLFHSECKYVTLAIIICMGIEIEKSALNVACRLNYAIFMITMFKVLLILMVIYVIKFFYVVKLVFKLLFENILN